MVADGEFDGSNQGPALGQAQQGQRPFLLATVSHESIVRVWDVLEEDSYLLSLTDVDDSLVGDKAVSIRRFVGAQSVDFASLRFRSNIEMIRNVRTFFSF